MCIVERFYRLRKQIFSKSVERLCFNEQIMGDNYDCKIFSIKFFKLQ